uniref:Uncharacterized protein n=1 Tax=Romanomermis culicivorax TaxID=13658 RepID=A0A915I4U1_ROMCU
MTIPNPVISTVTDLTALPAETIADCQPTNPMVYDVMPIKPNTYETYPHYEYTAPWEQHIQT